MTYQKSQRPFKLPPLSIIRALWKRKTVMGLVWLGVSVATAATVYFLPAVYKAETVILVESQRIPEAFVAPTVNADLRDRLSNLSQQILSYSRLLDTVKKFDLYHEERKSHVEEEVIEMMRGDIDIQLEQGWSRDRPGAFRVSYEGRNPGVVAQVANQLGNLFIDQNLRAREVQAVGTSEFLQNQLAEAKKRLEEQEAKLSRYKLQYNGELPEQENTLNAALARLQVQLQGVQNSMDRAQQEKLMQENALAAAQTSQEAMARIVEELSASDDERSGPGELPKESELLERELNQLSARYTEHHPEVKRIGEALEKARQREKDEAVLNRLSASDANQQKNSDSSSTTTEMRNRRRAMLEGNLIRERERVDNLKAQRLLAERQLETLNAERKQVLQQITSVQERLNQLPVREQQLATVTRDYQISKANYQSLLDKKLAAEMAADMERRQKSERFTMLDPARVPEKPVKPNRPLWYAAGSLLGLLLGMAIGFGQEWRRNALLGVWELPKDTIVLGRVPYIGMSSQRTAKIRNVVMALSGVFLVAAIVSVGVYFGWRS